MDTLADTTMPRPPDPTGRSFALLAQDERGRLSKLLRPLPWIDGLIAAMVVAPEAPPQTADNDEALDWLYLIWNEGSEAEVGKLTLPQSAEIIDPVMAHYVHVAEALCDAPEAYRPYLAGFGDPMEAASQWAAGFWGGLSINPAVWTSTLEDEDALPLLVAILSLVQDDDMPEAVRNDADSPFRDMPPDRREHMRRSALDMLPEIVLALHDYSLGLDEASDPS